MERKLVKSRYQVLDITYQCSVPHLTASAEQPKKHNKPKKKPNRPNELYESNEL